MKCLEPQPIANFEAFHHIPLPVCQVVKMGADGIVNQLDDDVCKLDEALEAFFHTYVNCGCPVHPVTDDQEYASSQTLKITEAPKILMLHLKRTIMATTPTKNTVIKKRHLVITF